MPQHRSFSASRRHNPACCAGLKSTNLSCQNVMRSCCHEGYTGMLLEVYEVYLEDSNHRFLFASPARSSTATCTRHLHPSVNRSVQDHLGGFGCTVIHAARFLIAHSLLFFVLAGMTPFSASIHCSAVTVKKRSPQSCFRRLK